MLRLLNPKPEQIALFFDLAAQERNEVPADIAKTLENKDLCRELRNGIDYGKLLKNGEYKNERKRTRKNRTLPYNMGACK